MAEKNAPVVTHLWVSSNNPPPELGLQFAVVPVGRLTVTRSEQNWYAGELEVFGPEPWLTGFADRCLRDLHEQARNAFEGRFGPVTDEAPWGQEKVALFRGVGGYGIRGVENEPVQLRDGVLESLRHRSADDCKKRVLANLKPQDRKRFTQLNWNDVPYAVEGFLVLLDAERNGYR